MPKSVHNIKNYNNVLSTIQSIDGEDKGSSGSDNDSAQNVSCDSECQDFNQHEQDEIMKDLLFALDPNKYPKRVVVA